MWQYFLGLGSNIEPEKNMVKIIDRLLEWNGAVDLSEIFFTTPKGMMSQNIFLNTVVRLHTNLERQELKQYLVKIEEELGRDRTDPNRKTKDRTADIDILFRLKSNVTSIPEALLPEEEYMILPLSVLVNYLDMQSSMKLSIPIDRKIELFTEEGTSIGKKATHLQRKYLIK